MTAIVLCILALHVRRTFLTDSAAIIAARALISKPLLGNDWDAGSSTFRDERTPECQALMEQSVAEAEVEGHILRPPT